MPYADGYDIGHAVFDRQKGFVLKSLPIKAEVSIKTVDPVFVKKHNIRVGEVMPWSRLKIIEEVY